MLQRGMEKFWIWLAWHLPRPLAYWAAIRVGANATIGPWSSQEVPSVTLLQTLQRW